jgi:N-acetylmuramoyl-L-alanine amidase
LKSTNRFIARTGSLAAALVALALYAIAPPALADAPLTASYQGRAIHFTHLSSQAGTLAVGVEDPGLAQLLRGAGAFLTWRPGERYVLITTSVPVVVSFAIGDPRYDIGPIALQASAAPFLVGDEAYLPLREVLRCLDLALRQDGNAEILQPQLSTLDVRQENGRVTLLAHAGVPLHARVVAQAPGRVEYVFDGVGTSLTGTRQVNAGGVRAIEVVAAGTVRAPSVSLSVTLDPNATAQSPQNSGARDVALAFTAGPGAPESVAAVGASPTPEPEPFATPPSGPAAITGVTVTPGSDGIVVSIAVSGSAPFEWHRLREPDNRFWIDFSNAQLQGAPIDRGADDPLQSVRVRQIDPSTVRVALSLAGPKALAIEPSSQGMQITIGSQDVADEPRSGSGSVGSVVAAEQNGGEVTPAPLDQNAAGSSESDDSAWKFGPHNGYVPTDPRLIVIDPGHGGSDPGTQHGGVSEATLTLDMAKRLRAILVDRGWKVKLTHDTNVDVYAPNDSAHDELQARVDVANKAGARLFVSIHANAYINPGPYGTTTYISKPEDLPFGHIVAAQLEGDGTKDDGVIKAHYYVTYHTRMPAVLIETAFLTNPNDYALLTDPAWREKVAQEIADGIAQYAREYPVANQPAQ